MSPCTTQPNFQEGKNSRISIRMDDWLAKEIDGFAPDGTDVLVDGAWNVNFDVEFASDKLDIGGGGGKSKPSVEGEKALAGIGTAVRDYANKLERSQVALVKKLKEQVAKALTEEKFGDTKAHERAKKELDSANKSLKSAIEGIRNQVRAIVKKSLDKARDSDIRTNGITALKEIAIAAGAFDAAAIPEDDALEDISDFLKKQQKKWLYFMMAATNNTGYMSVNSKKPVQKVKIKTVRKKSDSVPNNAAIHVGIVKYSGAKMKFRFRTDKKELTPKTLKSVIKVSAEKLKCRPVVEAPLDKMPTHSELKEMSKAKEGKEGKSKPEKKTK